MLTIVWAGFSLRSYSLGRLYSLHFILPIVVLGVVVVHLYVLHEYSSGSITRIGVRKVFSVYYTKDCITIIYVILIIGLLLI